MAPSKSHHEFAAELLKSAKTRNIEAGLPIAARWLPRAALAAGEALTISKGGGSNLIEERMLGPAEMILVGAPPARDAEKAAAPTIPLATPGPIVQWVDNRSSSGSIRSTCRLCGGGEGIEGYVLGRSGILGPHPCRENSQDGPIEPDVVFAIELLLGVDRSGRSLMRRTASERRRRIGGWW
ncbi:hypothetical protein PG999_004906 [Apiospora kogelbergensis]|uniref:Uncharacterized protein n=1 Tax=Apiospora kogelbergensis TaxID=1337665 RepID=A0AAW0R0M1_9PEZI